MLISGLTNTLTKGLLTPPGVATPGATEIEREGGEGCNTLYPRVVNS